MMKTLMWIGVTISLIGLVAVSSARADEWDKKTVLTFTQPVEIPGRVLPAGTYTFKLADLMGDRHVVQIFNADGSQIVATVITIADDRLTSTDQTVIKFGEMPGGSPDAIRAWFYPGNTIGQAFVYPKSRATQLAEASKAVVPALAVDVASVDDLKTVPIVTITPDQKETAVTAALETTPLANNSAAMAGTTGVTQTGAFARRNVRHLPKTASTLPLIVLMGVGSIAAAFGLLVLGKRTNGTV
jgi:LPXTG-motif cell wall-anchored protein